MTEMPEFSRYFAGLFFHLSLLKLSVFDASVITVYETCYFSVIRYLNFGRGVCHILAGVCATSYVVHVFVHCYRPAGTNQPCRNYPTLPAIKKIPLYHYVCRFAHFCIHF